MAPETVAFGVRLDADTVARLDALAAAHTHKRGWALARAVGAGLDALDGSAPPQSAAAPSGTSRALLDAAAVMALADALGGKLAPALVAAVTDAGRRPFGAEVAPVGAVGVARVVDALRAAVEFAATQPDAVARARLAAAATDAILALTAGDMGDHREGPNGAAVMEGLRDAVAGAGPAVSARAGSGPEQAAAAPRGPQSTRRASAAGEPIDLAPALKVARAALGLTQETAANAAGVSVVSYRRAEQGRHIGDPTRALLEAWVSSHGPA